MPRNITAQVASKGDELTRISEDGEAFEFRVRRGGYQDPSDNIFIYLDDPNENPLPATLFWQIEQNEAAIMYYDDGDGLESFSNETHLK